MSSDASDIIQRSKTPVFNFIYISFLIIIFLYNLIFLDISVSLPLCFRLVAVNYSVHFIRRIRLFVEELFYLKSRYRNNLLQLIKNSFYFTSINVIFFLFYVSIWGLLSYFYKENWKQVFNFGSFDVIIFCCFSLLMFLNLEECPLITSLKLQNFKGLDYGSGMAYSFFYGYLKILLPNTGGQDKNFLEFINLYESNHKVQFEVKKLFILIPISCFCPPSLENEFCPSIEESKPLDEMLKDVAGVKKRSYKNSIYKIKKPGSEKKIYAAIEYATPLKTFKEVINQRTVHSDVYEKHRRDIVSQFYRTLKQVLKLNPDCEELCELIYYNDVNSEGRYRDVGKIILKRIKEIKENIKKKRD